VKREFLEVNVDNIYRYTSPYLTDFENCCGADILSDFPSLSKRQLELNYAQYKRNFKRGKSVTLAEFKKQSLSRVEETVRSVATSSKLRLAIITEEQLLIKSILIKHGFRLVSDKNVNKNTGNRLYVFLRDPETPKGKNVKKCVF